MLNLLFSNRFAGHLFPTVILALLAAWLACPHFEFIETHTWVVALGLCIFLHLLFGRFFESFTKVRRFTSREGKVVFLVPSGGCNSSFNTFYPIPAKYHWYGWTMLQTIEHVMSRDREYTEAQLDCMYYEEIFSSTHDWDNGHEDEGVPAEPGSEEDLGDTWSDPSQRQVPPRPCHNSSINEDSGCAGTETRSSFQTRSSVSNYHQSDRTETPSRSEPSHSEPSRTESPSPGGGSYSSDSSSD